MFSEECIKAMINPGDPQGEQVVKAWFAPAHSHAFEALRNQPFSGTLHHAGTNKPFTLYCEPASRQT